MMRSSAFVILTVGFRIARGERSRLTRLPGNGVLRCLVLGPLALRLLALCLACFRRLVLRTRCHSRPVPKFSSKNIASTASTSYIEAQNLTMRTHIRRLTRLTSGFSKKLENFKAAVALHFAYYNFVEFHKTLRMTPAMAAGIESSPWTVADLVERSA